MIKIENVEVHGFESAIRGMRNPMNSWDKSDSCSYDVCGDCLDCDIWSVCKNRGEYDYTIGENDLKLMKQLAKAGNDHGKYLRFIDVTLDIDAPLYWWKEFKTYRTGVKDPNSFDSFDEFDIEMNSCSTMHKVHSKEFTFSDFSTDHLNSKGKRALDFTINFLNTNRELYLETKDKMYWWQIIQTLPTSYNQKRTLHLNYQVLKSMYFARRNHKLDEWVDFCKWIETLPYFKEIFLE